MNIIRHTAVTMNTLISKSNLIVEGCCVEPFEEEASLLDHLVAKPYQNQGLVSQVKIF